MRLQQYISEGSFTEFDIPKTFRVVLDIGRKPDETLKQISDGVLNGVKGISSNGKIIYQYLGVARDALLIMPGRETVKLNKLSRYLYDTPDYFFSNNMHHLKRLFMKERRQEGALRNIMEYLFEVIVKRGKMSRFDMKYMAPYQMMEFHKSAKTVKINSMKDFIKWFRRVYRGISKEDYQFKDFYYDILESISDKEYEDYIKQVFQEHIKAVYGSEEEWEVKDDKLKIPKKSNLYILKEDISDKKEDKIWAMMNHYTVERVEGIENAVKKYNLKSKMNVKYIEPKKWKDIQNRYLRRRD